MFADPLTAKLAAFVREIGIDVQAAVLDGPTFFPGVDIQHGALLIDEARLAHPTDILHEAGHVAVTDPAERYRFRLTPNGGEEMATLAWSYAAALHLQVPVELLFHPDQHNGWSTTLIENFTAGRYVGVPLLQWFGMTAEPRLAAERGVQSFPHMLRWVRGGDVTPGALMIRRGAVSDAPVIAAIHRAALRGALPHLPDLHTPDEDLAFFRDRVLARCEVWVDTDRNGTVIGFCGLGQGWIEHLYVAPSHQGRGVGGRLLRQAKTRQRSFQLWTFQRNARARRFYERHGFVAVRETDGSGNEEKEPDVLYAWSRQDDQAADQTRSDGRI